MQVLHNWIKNWNDVVILFVFIIELKLKSKQNLIWSVLDSNFLNAMSIKKASI